MIGDRAGRRPPAFAGSSRESIGIRWRSFRFPRHAHLTILSARSPQAAQGEENAFSSFSFDGHANKITPFHHSGSRDGNIHRKQLSKETFSMADETRPSTPEAQAGQAPQFPTDY